MVGEGAHTEHTLCNCVVVIFVGWDCLRTVWVLHLTDFFKLGQIQVKAWKGRKMEANTVANDDKGEDLAVDIKICVFFR